MNTILTQKCKEAEYAKTKIEIENHKKQRSFFENKNENKHVGEQQNMTHQHRGYQDSLPNKDVTIAAIHDTSQLGGIVQNVINGDQNQNEYDQKPSQ